MLLKCEHCEIQSHVFIHPSSGRLYRLKPPEEFNDKYNYLGSFQGWLFAIPFDLKNTIFLLNPFTGAQIDLPSWPWNPTSSLDIYCFRLSSAPTDTNCIVVVLRHSYPGFTFCRIGDDKWTKIKTSRGPRYSSGPPLDVLVFQGKFYLQYTVLPNTKSAAATNAEHPNLEILRLPLPNTMSSFFYDKAFSSFLVESSGEILLVLQAFSLLPEPETSVSLSVFRLDLSTLSWEKMEKIGNQVLFLGQCCSVSVPAAELGYGENHIYFSRRDGTSCVLNMEDGNIKYGLTQCQTCLCLNPM
ncbi:hypothetical protein MRB53_035775 [Persea americana]|uniref:Uncharacterized protein n=1 Tax=Persea americana TaxID=3435 RepID=A0ACC2K5K2_PERAE|nr:hypothetical protein MRB53_035775 [Persea americana]